MVPLSCLSNNYDAIYDEDTEDEGSEYKFIPEDHIEGEDGVYDMETEDEYEDNDSGKGLAPIMHEKKHPL